MKVFFLLAFILSFVFPNLSNAKSYITENYESKNYKIKITIMCPESWVDCDKVKYEGVSKKTDKKITLMGKTVHSTCADGKTPCQFQGYRFVNKGAVYFVDGTFIQVTDKKGEVILAEDFL